VAPRSRSGSRPGRALAGLGALILVMLISILGSQTFNPGNWHSQFKVGLGLDLSSGTQIVLKAATVKGTEPDAGSMTQAISVLESRVNGTGNSGAQVQQQGADLINVTVPGKAAADVQKLVSSTAKLSFRPVYLMSPAGSTTTTPSATPSGSASPSATPSGTATGSAKPTGSSTPTPSTSAPGTSTASPKASAQAEAARLASPTATPTAAGSASSTAKATATPTGTAKATATPTASPSASASASAGAANGLVYGNASLVNAATIKLFNKLVCTPSSNPNEVNPSWKATVGYSEAGDQWDVVGNQIVTCDASGNKYALGPAVFEGTDLTNVSPGVQQNSTQWVVNLSLNGKATKAFGTLTTNQFNKYYPQAATNQDDATLDQTAIVLDGSVQSAPQTQGALTTGQFTISGPQPNGFSQADATQLTNILKFGSLPINFNQQSVESVSPQLGKAQLNAGLLAGALGLLLVILYLFYYYRGLGTVSVSSLLIAALLAYLSVVLLSRYQNFTMSLSAIAGLVVAIGITADSFIVYFERLRDEVREGKTLRPAVESGWKRARRTILVSDTVSFLAALLLYHFAVSDVQGFAYTLGLTTLIDVIVVFLFTKPMVTVLAGTKFFSSGNKWSGLDPERLGAKTRWRSSTARTVRTQRTSGTRPGVTRSNSSGSSPSKEA
jgi:preprotein translocase subunit SecD